MIEKMKSQIAQLLSKARNILSRAFKRKKKPISEIPTASQLEAELQYENYKNRYSRVLRSTIYSLITVAAVAVLVATLLMPVLQIYGMSMTPSLTEGDIVVSVKGSDFKQGDVISFYYNNKILVKRVIAFPGDWVNIDDDGNVYVNEELLDEPYLVEKALGECDIELPYQVPDGKIFVCGDHRSTSIDSRSSTVGCVSEEQIVGKILFRVWPLNEIGPVK
ncbi:MAG: signal peptidase I [Acutalibacteraceae bacterium]|nr:signal peptidase I [Acutalibacteraceae bacterium]